MSHRLARLDSIRDLGRTSAKLPWLSTSRDLGPMRRRFRTTIQDLPQ